MNFKNFLKITEQNTVGTHNDFAYSSGAFIPSTWSGSEVNPEKLLPHLPSTDLTIPQVSRSGFVQQIVLNKNPICIMIKDTNPELTKIYLPYDSYKKLPKIPKEGDRITVVFQRHPEDNSDSISKIEKIEIN
jgi:hypothetical protein